MGSSSPGLSSGWGYCVPLSTQVDKWVPANLMLGGNPQMTHSSVVASCYRNQDKLRSDGPLDFTLYQANNSTNFLLLISIHWVRLHAQLQIRAGLDPVPDFLCLTVFVFQSTTATYVVTRRALRHKSTDHHQQHSGRKPLLSVFAY